MSSLIKENSFKRTPGKGVLFCTLSENLLFNYTISSFVKKMQIGTKKSS